MHRNIVLLPDPERPITAMMSPGSMSSDTRSSTVREPNRLTTPWSSTSDTERPFQAPAPLGQWEAHGEIDRRHNNVDGKGAVRRGISELPLARQFDEADHGGERCVLDELHEEANRRRDGDAYGLRHDDVAQLLGKAQAQRGSSLPLLRWDRLQTAAPDLAQESARVN